MSTELATGGPGRRPRRLCGPRAAPRSGAGRCVRQEPASFAEVFGVFVFAFVIFTVKHPCLLVVVVVAVVA